MRAHKRLHQATKCSYTGLGNGI